MSAVRTFFEQGTIRELIDYCAEVERLVAPGDVLNRLHEIVSQQARIRVHGANRFSVKPGDWRRIELGKTVFFHEHVPRRWIDEWMAFVASGHALGLMTARKCLAPFTWTELLAMLEPVGMDRWAFELALKHGMRDGYLCPVGGRWVVGFWSPRVLDNDFSPQARGLLNMAACATAVRLERLIGADVKRVGFRVSLTKRELSMLRHASEGKTAQEIADALGLGMETVRSHLKNAETKLGTRNRTHTVAEAMRQLLII